MFQRQTRQSFPIAYVFLAAVAAIALIVFVAKSTREAKSASPGNQISAPEENENRAKGQLAPEEWLAVMKEYPDFKPGARAYTDAMRSVAEAAKSRSGIKGFSAPWTVEGPKNIGARINSIKIHPTNPNIIYVGFSRGGVWKTTDGGQNWLPIFDNQAFLAIGDIELDPQNPNTVFVGTGDLNIGSYVAIGDGLWKSTDGGQTWKHLGLENQRIISKIVIHPTQSNIIYVAAMGLPFERNADRGLYKTTDGGQTWQKTLYIGQETGIIDLVMMPDNPNELLATAWDRIRTNTETFVTGENCKIWKTSNAGQNWQPLTQNGFPTGKIGRIGLNVSPQNPNLIYAVYADSFSRVGGVFRSTDRGANWTETLSKPEDSFSSFGWYFGKIFINPFNSDDIFVPGVELWRSLDAGETWFQASPPWWEYSVHADLHDMVFTGPNSFYLATDGGLYLTYDDGQSWLDVENIPTTQFYRVAVNPHEPEFYYGGAQDNGTTGGNATQQEWPRLYGGDGFQAAFHPDDPNILYFETQNGGITGFINGDYQSGTNGFVGDDRMHWDMQYFISGHDPEIMYVGTHRVYQSFGHAPNWFPISDDLTDGVVFEPRFHTISTICESPAEADLIYVGTTDANVWRGGSNQNWTNITAGLPERYVSSVKGSPGNPNRVFVTHTGYRDNDFTPKIHRSDNRGGTWVSIAGDLPNLAINDVLILPAHGDSVIFVATEGGVFGTINGGQNWERLGSGMPIVGVFDLEINPETKRLVAGTHARSIMTFPLDSLKLDENVSVFSPGKESAFLNLRPTLTDGSPVVLTLENLPQHFDAEVSVFDLSGKNLLRKRLNSGVERSLSIDCQGFAPGAYLVAAQVGGRVLGVKRFVRF